MAEVFPHTIHDMENDTYQMLVIPKDNTAEFTFTVNADRPQGLAIYDYNHKNIKEYISTDNFPSHMRIPYTDFDATYFFAGFSFYPAPLPNGKWIQSKMKIESSEEGRLIVGIGFDDYINDGDFNDIDVKIDYVSH